MPQNGQEFERTLSSARNAEFKLMQFCGLFRFGKHFGIDFGSARQEATDTLDDFISPCMKRNEYGKSCGVACERVGKN